MVNIIGNNIRTFREQTGINSSVLAQFLDVDQDLLSQIEEGKDSLSLSTDMLEKLVCLFGVSVDQLLGNKLPRKSFTWNWNFAGKDLSKEDLEVICAINRIVLNSEDMAEMLEKER